MIMQWSAFIHYEKRIEQSIIKMNLSDGTTGANISILFLYGPSIHFLCGMDGVLIVYLERHFQTIDYLFFYLNWFSRQWSISRLAHFPFVVFIGFVLPSPRSAGLGDAFIGILWETLHFRREIFIDMGMGEGEMGRERGNSFRGKERGGTECARKSEQSKVDSHWAEQSEDVKRRELTEINGMDIVLLVMIWMTE